MSDITVSLETAKKMKSMGRYTVTNHYYDNGVIAYEHSNDTRFSQLREEIVLAPTAQEILDELPEGREIQSPRNDYSHYSFRWNQIDYMKERGNATPIVEMLAEFRLRCKENNHLST